MAWFHSIKLMLLSLIKVLKWPTIVATTQVSSKLKDRDTRYIPSSLAPISPTLFTSSPSSHIASSNINAAWLSKVDLTTMAVVDQLQLADTIYNAVIDEPNGKAYFSTLQNPGNIYKINLAVSR